MMDDRGDSARVIAPPPLIYAGFLVAGLLLHWRRPRHILPSLLARPLGLALALAGAAFLGLSVRALYRAGTSPVPDQPTTALVETGPYSVTRNPIYLGMTLAYGGCALLVNALWPLMLLPGALFVIQRGVVEREESYLRERFGERYQAYCRRVGRWI